ncbi:MAG TPA: ParB/RepB/Spo0J family partition protein [Syntrophales bacterium]|nr:ParB/RepB/Spo0J family partition protein [Syntrophales bacterium]HQB13332.1 ParB/RepB/Spo0J family partition protein [Syntrophales bacterium]
MSTDYIKGRIYKIEVGLLQPDPQQPRKYFDPEALNELTASVRKLGVLQPVLFRRDDQGALFLVAGERRLIASQRAGLTKIPGIYVEGKYREISLVENILRENLTPVEEAEGMKLLIAEEGYSQTQLAEMLGKTQSSVSKTMTIANLPEDILAQVRGNPNIPKTMLLEAASARTEKGMRTVFNRYMTREAKKAAAAVAAKPRSSHEAAIINQVVLFQDKLFKVDLSNWNEENRQDLAVALQDVRVAADRLLREIGGEETEVGAEETEETPPTGKPTMSLS